MWYAPEHTFPSPSETRRSGLKELTKQTLYPCYPPQRQCLKLLCVYLYLYVYLCMYIQREREISIPNSSDAVIYKWGSGSKLPHFPIHRHDVCPSCPEKVPSELPKHLLVQHCPSISSMSFIISPPSLSQCSLPLKSLTRLSEVVFHRVRGAKMVGRPSPAVFA